MHDAPRSRGAAQHRHSSAPRRQCASAPASAAHVHPPARVPARSHPRAFPPFSSGRRGQAGLRSAISQAYAQLDEDQDGSLSYEDLEAYAVRNGLPTAYIQQFVDAVYDHDQQRHHRRQQQQHKEEAAAIAAAAAAAVAARDRQAMRGGCAAGTCGGAASCAACAQAVAALEIAQASCASVGSLDVADAATAASAAAACSALAAQQCALGGSAGGAGAGGGAAVCSLGGGESAAQQAGAASVQQQQPAPVNPLAALVAAALRLGGPDAARGFMGAAAGPHARGAGAAGGGGGGSEAAPARELTYSMFDRFVREREAALRKAFNMFDRGTRPGSNSRFAAPAQLGFAGQKVVSLTFFPRLQTATASSAWTTWRPRSRTSPSAARAPAASTAAPASWRTPCCSARSCSPPPPRQALARPPPPRALATPPLPLPPSP